MGTKDKKGKGKECECVRATRRPVGNVMGASDPEVEAATMGEGATGRRRRWWYVVNGWCRSGRANVSVAGP